MMRIVTQMLNHRLLPAGVMLASLLGALLLQHLLSWLPCPLCIIQRLSAIALFVLLLGWGLTPKASRAKPVWLMGAGLTTAAGLAAAGAHLWILWQPDTGSCAPGLARWVGQLVDSMPGSEWLLEGAGACEDARYALLGLPLPAWSAMAHVAALTCALVQRKRS